MNIKKATLLLILIFNSYFISLYAQGIPIGSWRVHFPFRLGKTLAVVNDKVYVGCDYGMYIYDIKENSTQVLSKIDGYSEYEISKLKYSEKHNTLIIGYKSGNIDILVGNKIKNIPDFKRVNFTGSKSINHININNDLAYLSTDAGLILIDLIKIEIKESYTNIGTNGAQVAIYSSAVLKDSLFVASKQGVMATSLSNSINRLNFSNWSTYDNDNNISTTKVKLIKVFNDSLYALEEATSLKIKRNSNWSSISSLVKTLGTCRSIDILGDTLTASFSNYVGKLTKNNIFDTIRFNYSPQEQILDKNNKRWIATDIFGLIGQGLTNWESHNPGGPHFINTAKTMFFDNKMMCLPGLINRVNGGATGASYGFYLFDNYWNNFFPGDGTTPFFKDSYDFHYSKDTMYIGTFNGLAAISQTTRRGKMYNAKNSPLTGVDTNAVDFNFISCIEASPDGKIYMGSVIRPRGLPNLFVKNGDKWETYSIPFNEARSVYDMVIDDFGNKWIQPLHGSFLGSEQIRGGGLLVFNEKNPVASQSKKLGVGAGNGNLTSEFVYSLAKAKNGEIWVGTDNGISVFYNPEKVLTSKSGFDASVPIYDSRALFREKIVTSITPDGGDRKWIGTPNDGAWLFSADGSTLIYNFTIDNSPLPSNNILHIGINNASGEVFFATDKGLVSFRGTANDPEEAKKNVSVFPNPVRPDFQGLIGINGVAENAIVKITDTNGKLIYQTRAFGGIATWDGRDLQGKRAETGIYLVFSATNDGEDGLVSKIAIID